MRRTWEHKLTPYTTEELFHWEEHERRLNERVDTLSGGETWREWLERRGHVYWNECSAPKCKDRPTFHASWRYVTGRAGRISSTRKHYCRAHAEKFAAKHDLPIEAPA